MTDGVVSVRPKMTAGDRYRAKAAQFQTKASAEDRLLVRQTHEGLGRIYLRLAEQADRAEMDQGFGQIPPPEGNDEGAGPNE
jgi:hypothetical protein